MEMELLNSFFGALAAGLFAFLFLKFGEFLRESYIINQKHYDALKRLQIHINMHLDEIYSNINVLNNLANIYKKMKNTPTLTNFKARPIIYEVDIINNIRNEFLLNKFFSYSMKLRKYNNDIENLNDIYKIYLNGYLQKSISSHVFIENSKKIGQQLEEIVDMLDKLDKVAVNLLSVIRVRLKKDKKGFWCSLISKVQKHISKNFEEKVEKEEIKVSNEREAVKKKSREFYKN